MTPPLVPVFPTVIPLKMFFEKVTFEVEAELLNDKPLRIGASVPLVAELVILKPDTVTSLAETWISDAVGEAIMASATRVLFSVFMSPAVFGETVLFGPTSVTCFEIVSDSA